MPKWAKKPESPSSSKYDTISFSQVRHLDSEYEVEIKGLSEEDKIDSRSTVDDSESVQATIDSTEATAGSSARSSPDSLKSPEKQTLSNIFHRIKETKWKKDKGRKSRKMEVENVEVASIRDSLPMTSGHISDSEEASGSYLGADEDSMRDDSKLREKFSEMTSNVYAFQAPLKNRAKVFQSSEVYLPQVNNTFGRLTSAVSSYELPLRRQINFEDEHTLQVQTLQETSSKVDNEYLLLDLASAALNYVIDWNHFLLYCFFLALTSFISARHVPSSSYWAFLWDLLIGLFSSMAAWFFLGILTSVKGKRKQTIEDIADSDVPIDIESLRPDQQKLHTVWMSELKDEYNPGTFSLDQAVSVFVQLKGTILTLSYPQEKISPKALWNDRPPKVIFTNVKKYNIFKAKVSLTPETLNRKRMFRRRFPIKLTIDLYSCNSYERLLERGPKLKWREVQCLNGRRKSVSEPSLSLNTKSKTFYLFPRASREKQHWFHLFQNASSGQFNSGFIKTTPECFCLEVPEGSRDRTGHYAPRPVVCRRLKKEPLNFRSIMEQLLQEYKSMGTARIETSSSIAIFNIFFTRLGYNVLTEDAWCVLLTRRIQKRLNRFQLPGFVKSLDITHLYLGTSVPKFSDHSFPTKDEYGLWMDFVFDYEGDFTMTFECKLDMTYPRNSCTRSRAQDPDDDLDESCSNSSLGNCQEKNMKFQNLDTFTFHEKIWKVLDKVVRSQFFQNMTYVKRMFNNRLTLTVDMTSMSGIITVNIPDETDRIWVGFRNNPEISFKIRPCYGEAEFTMNFLIRLIENKIRTIIEKELVLPNMEDIVLPNVIQRTM